MSRMPATDWRARFPDAPPVALAEGGAVYAAQGEGAWWIIRDASTAVDLLSEEDAAGLASRAVQIDRFDSRDAWLAALEDVRRRSSRRATADVGVHRVSNADLREHHLPRPSAPWHEISRFAGSFRGYAEKGGVDGLARFAHEVRAAYDRAGRLPSGISDLRSVLAYEQRSDHFSDSATDPATLSYIHAVVEALRAAIRRRGSSEPSAADPIAVCLADIARNLLEEQLPTVGGTLTGLRERHLSESVKTVLGRHLGMQVVSTVIALDHWPSLGRSGTDFVSPPAPRRPRHVGELKWCQAGDDKIAEAVWDLFKMALTARQPGVNTAHLITGAPEEIWSRSPWTDLFDGGTFTAEELCVRRYPSGGRRTVWDHLLEGGYDRYPDRVPAHLTTIPVGDVDVTDRADLRWVVRAVRVDSVSGLPDVPFIDGWPHGRRPADARRPLG